MTAIIQNILDGFYAGNAKTIAVTVSLPSGNPKDLTSATVTYGVVDEDDQFVILKSSLYGDTQVKITDAGNGVVEVYIAPGNTIHLNGTYTHHMNVVDANGDEETVLVGRVNIFKSFARRFNLTSQSAYLAGG